MPHERHFSRLGCAHRIRLPEETQFRTERLPPPAAACQRLGWDASRDMIAKIEGQTRWVSDSEWVFLARALRVRLEELLPTAARRALEARFL